MKVITWFYSNSELINKVIRDGVNVAENSSEDENNEDMDVESDDEVQVEQVIRIRLISYYSKLNCKL